MLKHCFEGTSYAGGVACLIMSYFNHYAAGIGALIIVLTFVFGQYHNYRMRQQGRNRNQILKDKKD